jgi:hypothetical protein
MCDLWRVEVAKLTELAIYRDVRAPFFPSLVPIDALKSALVVTTPSLIGLVLRSSSFSQIRDAVVVDDAVFVINTLNRPHTMDMQPSKPVSSVVDPLYSDLPITSVVQ